MWRALKNINDIALILTKGSLERRGVHQLPVTRCSRWDLRGVKTPRWKKITTLPHQDLSRLHRQNQILSEFSRSTTRFRIVFDASSFPAQNSVMYFQSCSMSSLELYFYLKNFERFQQTNNFQILLLFLLITPKNQQNFERKLYRDILVTYHF